MDYSLNTNGLSSPLATLPPFVAVLDSGYHPVGRFSFLTQIADHSDVERYAVDCLEDIDVQLAAAGWGEEGLVLDFTNQQDLSLFALAFRGPRMR